jgi:hypothetical protein
MGGSSGSGGGTGGTPAPGVCGARAAFGPHLSGPIGVGSSLVSAYDGPATVERSTSGDLVLVYAASQGAAADGGLTDPDAGAQPTVMISHATIYGLQAMPLFPLDAQVWLSTHALNNPPTFYRTDPWSIAVRDREGGTLLFGGALDPSESAPSPVPIGAPVADCVVADYKPACTVDNNTTATATMTYESVEVQGDTPVVIHDSQPGHVSIGGVAYDVRLTARRLSPGCYFNSPNEDGIALDIQASQLADLAGRLDIGAPPSCRLGNDPGDGAFFDLNGVADTSYDGPAIFKGIEATTTYDFEIPGLLTSEGKTALLRLEGAGASLPAPAVGQQFWLSWSDALRVLRETRQGAILLAQFYGRAQPDGAQPLAALLGTDVTLERQCAYTESIDLWDAVFGTTPPVRVATGTVGTFAVGGRTYRAWVYGDSSIGVLITIYAGN